MSVECKAMTFQQKSWLKYSTWKESFSSLSLFPSLSLARALIHSNWSAHSRMSRDFNGHIFFYWCKVFPTNFRKSMLMTQFLVNERENCAWMFNIGSNHNHTSTAKIQSFFRILLFQCLALTEAKSTLFHWRIFQWKTTCANSNF